MSKAAKSRAKLQRKTMKRSRKAAQKAQYESWAADGRNNKSKRNRLRSSRDRISGSSSHPDGPCGNLACVRDFEDLNNPWNAKPDSCIYGKRFSSSKWRLKSHATN